MLWAASRLRKRAICIFAMSVSVSIQHCQAEVTFEGKSIIVMVGFEPGGTADADGRMIARHLGKYLPGNPSVVVQNRPGAGGINSVNLAYSSGRPDGLTIYQLSGAHLLQQLAGSRSVRFDLGRMPVVGAWLRSSYVLTVRGDGPYTSVDAIRKAKVPPRIGTQGIGTGTYSYAVGWGAALRLNVELLRGYEGNAQTLALQRGEIDARTTTVSNMAERGADWMRAYPAIVQSGPQRDPDLPDVATVDEIAADPGPLWTVINGSLSVDRPYALAPGTPIEISAVFRRAWKEMLVDSNFVADAKAMHWRVAPTSFADLEALYRRPASDYGSDVISRIKELFP